MFTFFEISGKFLSSTKVIQAEKNALEHLLIKQASQSIKAFIFNKHGFLVPSEADTVFMSQSSLLKMCHFFVEINIVQSGHHPQPLSHAVKTFHQCEHVKKFPSKIPSMKAPVNEQDVGWVWFLEITIKFAVSCTPIITQFQHTPS